MLVLWLCAFVGVVYLTPSQAASSGCEDPPLDISLVIDRTKSIGPKNYEKMLDSIMNLIEMYTVGEDKTRFSIVTYAGDAKVRVSLGDSAYYSQEALKELLQGMKAEGLGSPTRTDKALETVGEEVFVDENGDRRASPNIMIVFTDGNTHDKSEPFGPILETLKEKGVHRVAVGIGRKIDQSELETIAGDPGRVLRADDFDDLKNQLYDIHEATCNIDGGYTEWTEWSECSATCGGGVRWHSRTCNNPEPKNKGKTCTEQELGPSVESGYCNTQDCPVPGGYTDWSEWGECSVTCGGGVQKRTRTCTSPPPSGGGPTCIEQNLGPAEEEQECNTQDCAVPGGYTDWSEWGDCSVTCGGGVQKRTRTCTSPPPSGGGPTCIEQDLGQAEEVQDCNTQDCAVPGGYTDWSKWGECSVTCGGGVQRRTRTCTSPPPSNGGPTCIEQSLGPAEDEKECNTQDCPVPGGYTDWSEWGECSVTCGGGVQRRTRTCTSPPPSNGGPTCIEQSLGPAEDEKECNTQDCGKDGNWSPWGNPGPCDKSCGGGTRKRQRTCTNPPPSGNGKDCKGSNTKSEPCNTQPCPTEPPPPKPCKEHLDVGVIIDSSNSISTGDYSIARRYIIQLAERLDISEAGTHMAILLYSWEAHTWHRFTDAQSINKIRSKANDLPHIRGGTRTDRALELAAEDFFGWEDSGDRPDKPNVLIVLTDGDTNEGSKPFSQVIPPLDDADVRRVAVGIGSGVDVWELRQIASANNDVLQVSGYGSLYSKLEDIMKMACEEQYPGDCGNWGSYGGCSKACGGGVQVRTRTCPANNLHLRKQKKHCNTNLCPGQSPCKDKQGYNCTVKAASGECWKKAEPSTMFYIGKKFTLWDLCPKSCRRCNVDTSCQDGDPYICPWWSQAVKNKYKCNYRFRQGFRTYYLRDMCKKSCNQCSSGGGGGGGGGAGGGGGGGGGECKDLLSYYDCRRKMRYPSCRNQYVKAQCPKSCGVCGGSGGGGHGGGGGGGYGGNRPGWGRPWGRR
ncbi:coadhesin-like isoform X1 [Oculina patagonica]